MKDIPGMKDIPKHEFPARPRLVFMGTPAFAVPPLKALIDAGHQIQAVVTQPDKPKGRGRKTEPSPVKQFALAHSIEVLQPEKASEDLFCETIERIKPDLVIVVAFGQILKKKLLAIPKWGVINIHASLLPKLRGAAPIPWAILNEETRTGLTIMQMDEGLDTGPMLFQKEVPILENETAGELGDRLSALAGELMVGTLKDMSENRLIAKPQDHGSATYAPKIEREKSIIDWTQSALRLSALIRGLDPKPGAYSLLHEKELKLFSPRLVEEKGVDSVPGRVAGCQQGLLLIETGQGRIGIRELQYPGKKRLAADAFLRGFPIPEGPLLGK
jgi:methionyl-tRNA formyltransferase